MGLRWYPTLIYSFAHFAVDLGCAFAMFSACESTPIHFLLYNFCAFAMQMPLGLLADAWGKNRRFAVAGALLVAAICCLPSFGYLGAVAKGKRNGVLPSKTGPPSENIP